MKLTWIRGQFSGWGRKWGGFWRFFQQYVKKVKKEKIQGILPIRLSVKYNNYLVDKFTDIDV